VESFNEEEHEKQSIGYLCSSVKENLSITKGLLYSLIYVLVVTLAAYPGLAMHTQIKLLEGVPNATNWLAIYI
jgi:hypothetical protein